MTKTTLKRKVVIAMMAAMSLSITACGNAGATSTGTVYPMAIPFM